METIRFRELVELFLNTSFREIKTEYETPNINFIFGDDGFVLFKNIVENPFIKEGFWTPNAKSDDIDYIITHSNDDAPTLHINDSISFFEYLTNIINEAIKLNKEYEIESSARNLAMHILRRIWLRLGIEDMQNVEYFLKKQLEFVQNRVLDTHTPNKVNSFYGYDVFMKTESNPTWDETTRSMIFTVDNKYELPHILYDIDGNNVCYIYGVQSSSKNKDKEIERKLYKLNKNIDNPNVHPAKVYALMLFIEELNKKGITEIRFPSMQILSYRYHELLSEESKNNLEKTKKEYESYPTSYTKERYEYAKTWYDKTYNKQDKISYLKTEELFNLAYRMLDHIDNIEITNIPLLQSDYLGIKIKTKK